MSQITVQLSARCAWWLAPMLKTYAALCWLILLPPSAALIEWLVRRAIKVKAEV
ncbi:hypothetical protein [Comamonas sp.]|uniref:hypothetical protein n=1 Tax=Comamonas sp. TaxID=34028 RepID=UPI0028A2771E|nr:hypothetical protein [Comamonas sp.]